MPDPSDPLDDTSTLPGPPPRFDLSDEPTLRIVRGLAAAIGDTIVIVNDQQRVVAWNGAAEALYGISATDAIGAPIFELFDSTIVGEVIPRGRPWELALERGLWRGRTIDVPLRGPNLGRDVTVEVILSPIHGLDDSPTGVVCIKRDVTAAARLERDLAAIGSLVTMTGGSRPIEEVARSALDILIDATSATVGGIFQIARDQVTLLADTGIGDPIRLLYGSITPDQSPLIASIRQPGTVVSGDVRSIRMLPAVAQNLTENGIRTIAAVGLHRADELVGLVFLGWSDPNVARPSSAVLLQASSHVERGLSNAAVAGEAAQRAHSDRALARRLATLDELTRAGEAARTVEELAQRTAAEVQAAVGALGVVYHLFDDAGGAGGAAIVESAGLAAEDAISLLASAPDVDPETEARSRLVALGMDDPASSKSGAASRASIPIRIEGRVVGAIVALFDRPPEQLAVDEASLDSVARIASISLANFRLRERLERSEARYRLLFEVSPQAMFVIDAQDQIVIAANEAGGRLLARPVDALIGSRLAVLGPFDDAWIQAQFEILRTTGRVTFEQRGFRPDGSTFPAIVDAALVELDGRPRILTVARDLTDSERLQSELVQAQKMEAISQLVAGVAHELNNPLTAIIAFSRFIRDSADLPEDLRSDAELLVGEADRTQQIVRNLLDFARQRPPERVATRLSDLVKVVLDLQAYAFRTGRVHVEVDLSDDLPTIEIDRGQISQVILNLTLNAVEAIRTTEPGTGTVRIVAEPASGDRGPIVRLSIIDDGPGVDAANVEHLFTPFFTTKEPGEGTGLGLAVSFGIAAAHGGRLAYRPNPAGRGAMFILEIPVGGPAVPVAEPAEPPVTALAVPGTDGPPSILVLDDEVSIRRLLQKALTSAGMEVTLAADGPEAIEYSRERSFDVIVCDHRMAGMDGTEVFGALAEVRPDLIDRFVFMSGDVMNPELAVFAERHGTRMLEKPFLIEDVVQLVREVVATRRSA